jgi:hypothetical protein
MRVYSDHDVIAALRADVGTSMKPVERFYLNMRREAFKYVTSNGGHEIDSERVLQYGMLTLHAMVRTGKYKSESSLGNYFMGICRWHWYQELRKRGNESMWKDAVPTPAPESLGQRLGGTYVAVRQIFDGIEEGCRRVLTASFSDQKRMVDITGDKGIPDEQNAQSTKWRCLRKMKEMIAADPQIKRELHHIWERMQ